MELHRFFRYAIEKMCKEKKSLNHFYISFLLKQYILYYISTRFFYQFRLPIIFIISIISIFILPNIEAEQGLSFLLGVLISENYNKVCSNRFLTRNILIFTFFCIGTIFLATKQLPIIREYENHFIYNWVQLFIKLPYAIFFILIIHKFSIFKRKFLTFTGIISYELYLTHMIFLQYIDMKLINAFIILIISFVLSYFFYLLNQYINTSLKKRINFNF
jgi:peptidoglycan/LPS O-acetylase OafA/YrhL